MTQLLLSLPPLFYSSKKTHLTHSLKSFGARRETLLNVLLSTPAPDREGRGYEAKRVGVRVPVQRGQESTGKVWGVRRDFKTGAIQSVLYNISESDLV